MFLDVDGLKQVNDVFGHANGDVLLQAVAERIVRIQRKQDFFARLGGDEFMAILPGVGNHNAVEPIVASLINSFRQTIFVGENKVRIGVSVGISFFPGDANTVGTLMNYADKAMYEAKKNGGSQFLCYSQLNQ
jgi:diguanylate cyclase (GGDEF)-like protein